MYGPETGSELDGPVTLLPVADRRTVHVIGGGPAGLEVARVAAFRGHAVTLYEASAELGGRLLMESRVPGRKAMGAAVRWLTDAVERAEVDVVLGRRVSTEEIRG